MGKGQVAVTKAKKVSIIKEPSNRIRISGKCGPLKLPVARVFSEWLSANDRTWKFSGSVDNNVTRLCKYVASRFEDYEWTTLPSQKPFDIVSIDAGVIIEVKSVVEGSSKLITNASIYPDKVKVKDVMNNEMKTIWPDVDPEKFLDVLVVCVNRSKDNVVTDYAIVDGSYWGFTYEDYVSCRNLFRIVNNSKVLNYILKALSTIAPTASFISKLVDGRFGAGCDLKLRSLITLTNPVGRLNVSGWWGTK